MNVLLLAEACNPEWTSVPLVGFNMVQALTRQPGLTVTLATHIRNREAFERHSLSDDIEIIYINNEWLAAPLYRLGSLLRGGGSLGWTTNMAVNWPAYLAFESQLYRALRSRLEQGEFDLIHRITPISPTLPSILAAKTDVPMMIGPLNGGLPWPTEFPELRAKEKEWLAPVRGMYKLMPGYQKSCRHLTAVISGSRHTASELPPSFRGTHYYLPENGIDEERFVIAESWTAPKDRFEFITVGRLVPYKGFDMVIEAFASSPLLKTCQLTFVGDGPQRDQLQEQIREAGVEEQIRLTGWMPQGELSARLRGAQAFTFPSLREFGGGVVLEAMASGLPCIIADYGGPAELVNKDCGVLIPLDQRATMVQQLTAAMESLAADDQRCRRLSAAALKLVREQYTWDRKAATVIPWYHDITGTETRLSSRESVAGHHPSEATPSTEPAIVGIR